MKDLLRRFVARNFGVDREYIRLFDDMLGVVPYNVELYKLALIHKSASIFIDAEDCEGSPSSVNNERLEYLGDAVLEAVTSDFLYIEYPNLNEGALTQLRAKIVSRQSLNQIANSLGLNDVVIYKSSGRFTQKHIFGDAFEAIIGAIYLDQGYEVANRFIINNIFKKHIDFEQIESVESDFKSRLIEWAQKEHLPIEFKTHSDKDAVTRQPIFISKVFVGGVQVGHGAGDSKKEAEQQAAFSVSQGISDRDSDAILSKIDELDADKM